MLDREYKEANLRQKNEEEDSKASKELKVEKITENTDKKAKFDIKQVKGIIVANGIYTGLGLYKIANFRTRKME